MLGLVNARRAAAGCGGVTAGSGLAALARTHSADMRDRDYVGDVDPDGLAPADRGARAGIPVLAEIVAKGQPTADAVMATWMADPAQRATLLDCAYTTIGVGVADGPGGPWWTQDFD